VDCSQPDEMLIAVDFTDLRTKGRYSFQTTVYTPGEIRPPNMWSIETSAGDGPIDSGATGGFQVYYQGTSSISGAGCAQIWISLLLAIAASSIVVAQ